MRAMVALGAALLWPAPPLRAELPKPRASDGVTIPAQTVSSTDDASAIALNPANVALGPAPEARFTWVHTGEGSPLVGRGYALDLALPVWMLGTGLRVDWLRPPESAPAPYADPTGAHPYQWVRWPLALRLGQWAALGTTLSWSNARSPQLDGLFAVAAGLTIRPSRYLSTAVVVRDLNEPDNSAGGRIEPSVDFGAALRPVDGRSALEIAVEGSYRGDDEPWVPKLSLAADVPYLGRFRGGAELLDPNGPQAVLSAGLELNVGPFQAGAGPVFGNALTTGGTGFYATAAMRAFRGRPGLPLPARVARLRIESTPDVREHTALLGQLWRLATDREIEGVLLELRAKPADSLAHAEELADAIGLLRARGKKVLCHLEDAGGRSLYACAAADRIGINPAGGLRFAGLSTRYFYFGGLLDALGVRADFVRIGEHKLAPEQFAHADESEVGRQDHKRLLGSFEDVFLRGLGRGRQMDRATAAQRVAQGPFIATEARQAGLVDELVYEDEIDRFVELAFGRKVTIQQLAEPEEAPTRWRTPPRIAVVYLHGDMIDGESMTIPLLGIRLAGSYTVAKALREAREDPTVAAVVFRIETGGGSSLAADIILREASLTAKTKPLIVSMGSRAASGGYYAAVAAREIYANRATVTGSIGIFYGKVDVAGLLDKIGVRTRGHRTAPRADAESLFRPFSDEERQELGVKVKQFYDLFVGRVAEGRRMSPAAVHAVGAGRAWTGQEARERGLVDRLGGLRQAIERARELGRLPADAPIVELPVERASLLEWVLELAGVPGAADGAPVSGWVPPPLVEMAKALVPFMVFEPSRPLALMELVASEP